MLRKPSLLLFLFFLLLSACSTVQVGPGPKGGVKSFTVIEGSLDQLKNGSSMVILGPFKRHPKVYGICRGEEAATFADSFSDQKLFNAHFFFDNQAETLFTEIKGFTPEQVRNITNAPTAPEFIVAGELLHYLVNVHVFDGTTKQARYLLKFHNLNTGLNTVIEVEVEDGFQFAIPTVVSELALRMAS